MQQNCGGYNGRKAAHAALLNHNIPDIVIEAISDTITNEGNITSGKGGRFAITQISAS